MFKKTDRQVALFDTASSLPSGARRRLEKSWAGGFARKLLPVLLEQETAFATLYSDKLSRPNWSVARMLGLMLLQEFDGCSDQDVLDRLSFDVRYQYALGVDAGQSYLSRRSYVGFRSRLATEDPQGKLLRQVFDAIGEAAISDLNLALGEQRVDSTQITSNIQVRGRAYLFGTTLKHFFTGLKAKWPGKPALLSEKLRQWCNDESDNWFGMKSAGEQKVALHQRALWLVEIQNVFADDSQVREDERYILVSRLVAEHVSFDDKPGDDGKDGASGGGDAGGTGLGNTLSVRNNPVNSGAILQSPFDPDAGYGHKGSGYSVQITETCRNDAPEIVTDFEVTPANESDQGKAQTIVDRLIELGRKPDVLYADAGYASGKAFAAAQTQGVTLFAPVRGQKLPSDQVGRDAFVLDDEGMVVQCPEAHAPAYHKVRKSLNARDGAWHAYFSASVCRSCKLVGRCVVRENKKGSKAGYFRVELLPRLVLRDERLKLQRTSYWRDQYAIRSGVEATMSELKCVHRMGSLRSRGLARVLISVTMKVAACNTRRWLRGTAEPSGAFVAMAAKSTSEASEDLPKLELVFMTVLAILVSVDSAHADSPWQQTRST